jgi:hypothetical protein
MQMEMCSLGPNPNKDNHDQMQVSPLGQFAH